MNRREFEERIKNRNLPKYMMFYGDSFLMDRSLKIAKEILKADEEYTFYTFEYEFKKVEGLLSQGSLFGESTLIILKSEERIEKRELESFIKLINSSEDKFLIYFSTSKKLGNHELFKNNYIFFPPLNLEETVFEIGRESRSRGFEIEEQGIEYLIYLKRNSVSEAISELDKLQNLGKSHFSVKDIKGSVSTSGEVKVDEVISYFFKSGDWQKSVNLIEKYGINEIEFITFSLSYVESLYKIKIGRELHFPRNILIERETVARNFSMKTVGDFLHILMRKELQFKQGKYGDKEMALGELLIELHNSV
jgi:DNA polymerase-3 subunit delta